MPGDDPFWQRMQAIWDAQKAAGYVPRSAEEVETERRLERGEWEAHQQAIERLSYRRNLMAGALASAWQPARFPIHRPPMSQEVILTLLVI